MKLKLREIIWEVTGKCNNGCNYCGSKDVWKTEVDEIKIKKFADKIAEFPPEEIDISGGDPLLVSLATHKYITEKLKPTTKCKILINPKSFQNLTEMETNLEKLRLYDWAGVSINTIEELNLFKNLNFQGFKYTVITNFNLTNFFLVDEFAQFVLSENVLWQIQFTMYHAKDKEQQLALYNYPAAVEKLNQEIAKYANSGIRVIFSDNVNRGDCTAGISSLGVLANGDVVPCLSMRSWCDINKETEGSLTNTKLKEIWYNGFKEQRFETFKCCKDVCNRCLLNLPDPNKVGNLDYNLEWAKVRPFDLKDVAISVYAVQTTPMPPSYPYPPAVTTLYACATSDTWGMAQQFPPSQASVTVSSGIHIEKIELKEKSDGKTKV